MVSTTKRAAVLIRLSAALGLVLAGAPWGSGAQPAGPEITVLENGVALAEGAAFNRAVTPVIEVTPASGSQVDAQLNGVAYLSGTAVEAEGSYTLSVVAHDAEWNESTLVRHFSIDLTAPAIVSLAPPTGTLTAAASATLTGQVAGATLVTVNGGAVSLGTPVGGVASFTGGPYSLAEGDNDFTVVARDAAGNTASAQRRLVRDSTSPALTVSSPAAGGVVPASPVTVTGTAVDPHLSEVRVAGALAVLAGEAFTASAALAEGANSLSVSASDAAGNATTQDLTVTLDTQAPLVRVLESGSDLVEGTTFTRPAVPVLQVTDSTATTVSATLDGAPFTSGTPVAADGAHTLVVEATDAAGNARQATVHFEVDATPPTFLEISPAAGSVLAAAEVTLAGRVLGAAGVTVDGQAAALTGEDFVAGPFALVEGPRTFTLVATDAAGNATTRSHTVVRDATAPQVSLTQPVAGALLPSTPILVLGTASDAHLAEVEVNGITATSSGLNFAAAQVPLAEGENTLTAVARDRAGNEGQASRQVVLDSQTPEVAILDPAAGTVVPGGQITVAGTAADPHLDRVEVNGTRAVLAGTSWTVTVALQEGENTLTARAIDRLGHASTASVAVSRDSTAPAVAIGAPAEGARLSVSTVTVSGTVDDEPGIIVRVNGLDATVTGGTFTAQAIPLVEGENRLIARATDASGNQGSRTRLVVRDSQAPSFLEADPAAGALAVPGTAVFVLAFSEEMAEPAAGALSLETASGSPLAATVTVDAEALEVRPAALLASGAEVRLVLSAALTDLAGNPLANPQTLGFGVADAEAPAAPVVDPVPRHLCAPSVVLTGTTEAEAWVEVRGGAAEARTRSAADGRFELAVALVPSALQRLLVSTLDAGGNRSAETLAEVAHDCVAPEVISAERLADALVLGVSEPLAPETVAAAGGILVTGPGGPVAGGMSYAPGTTTARFEPASGLPAGPLELEVTQAWTDLAGNPLAYPYARVFGAEDGSSFLSGRVIDQHSGRPLAGAQVVVIATGGTALPAPQPQQTTGPEGAFQIPVAAGAHLVAALRPGYTPAFRLATTAPAAGTDVFDPRLTPQAPGQPVAAGGASISGGEGMVLSFPAGALPAGTEVRATPLEEQALPALLPFGWSPEGAVWIDLEGQALGEAATLSLPVDAPDGTLVALVRLDLGTLAWRVQEVVAVEDGAATTAILEAGGYAAVAADTGTTAPPAAVAGEPLAAGPGPQGDEIASAALAFEPQTVLPAQRALATVDYTLNAPAPSGLPLTLVVEEELELLDGGTRSEPAYRADLLLFHTEAGEPRSRFGLRPSAAARLLPIAAGVETVAVSSYGGAAVGGGVLGTGGGTVTDDEGDEVTVPAGALAEATAVVLARRPAAELPLPAPAGTELVGALALDLGGRLLSAPAGLSFAASPPPDGGERGVLLAITDLGAGPFLRPVAEITPAAGGWATVAIDPEDLPWPGVRAGGTFLFARFTAPHGYLRGTVIDVDDQPLAGAVVSAAGVGWAQIAGGPPSTPAGRYAFPAPVGTVTLVAEETIRGNRGEAQATISEAEERVDRDIALVVVGPAVVEMSPADGATGVPVGVAPTVRFSEPVDRASLAGGIELLEDGEPVAIAFDHQGSLVTVLPQASLAPGGSYELEVGGGVRDLAGYPLPSPRTAQFTTQVTAAGGLVDLSRVLAYAPDAQGMARVVGQAGTVPGGTLVAVENRSSATVVSATAAADGSFELPIAAALDHSLVLHVFPAGGNEIVLALPPFVAADGRTAFVGTEAASFTTIDGITLTLEAGTFTGPSTVSIRPVAVAPPGPQPVGVAAVYAFDLSFGALEPVKRIELEVPAPPGPPSMDYLVMKQAAAPGGGRFYMLFELLRRDGDRLTTAPLPASALHGLAEPGVAVLDPLTGAKIETPPARRDRCMLGLHKDGVYQVWQPLPETSMGMVGIFGGAADQVYQTGELYGALMQATLEDLISADLLCIPTLMDRPLELTVTDLRTGAEVWSGTFAPPAAADEVLVLPPESLGDDLAPWPVAGSPLRLTVLEPGQRPEAELFPGIRLAAGAGSITVTGEPGAADGGVQVRLLRLPATADDEGPVVSTATAEDGAFTLTASSPAGARFVLGIGAKIGSGQPLEIGFSEALAESFPGLEVLDSEGRSVAAAPRPVGSQAVVRLAPPSGWQAGKTYTLLLAPELADVAGNAWGQRFELAFEVESSEVIDTYPLLDSTYDFAQLGSWLFVAGGEKGLAVLDISDPGEIRNVLPNDLTFPFEPDDPVRGVTVDPHGRVLVVGGGLRNQGLLKIFDPLRLDPEAVAANPGDPEVRNAAFRGKTRICDANDPDILGTELRSGFPQKVAVLSQDDRDTWIVGEAPPAGLQVTPGAMPPEEPGSEPQAITVTVGGLGVPGLPVTLRNLTRGRWQRVDSQPDGSFSSSVGAYRGDRLELLRNRASVAYVAVLGSGIVAVDVDYVYTHPELDTLDVLAILGIYDEDPALALCGEPRFDFGGFALDVDLLVDAGSPVPITLASLALMNGPALLSSNPSDVGDMRFVSEGCAHGESSANVTGMDVAQSYAFDWNGDGRLAADEERDYAVVSQSGDGIFVFDVTDRLAPRLAGRVRLPGQARGVRIDRLNRRLLVAGSGSGLFVVDFDAVPSVALADANGDGLDDRLIETVDLHGFNTLAPPWVLPELGVVFTGGLSEQEGSGTRHEPLSSVAVGGPKLAAVARRPENGEWKPLAALAPFGVPTPASAGTGSGAEGEDLPGVFRLLAALPGSLGPQIELAVESLGPGRVRIDGLGEAATLDGLPAVALEDEDAVVLTRQSDDPLDEGYSRYLSAEIAVLADPRAARDYERTEEEGEQCTRCDLTEENVSSEAEEILSGDLVAARFPPALRASLAEIFTATQLEAAGVELPSTRWELAPSVRQEPSTGASLGAGDVAPGTLLHSGEASHTVTDLVVAGRGLDFAFTRSYRSQTIGAGPLGPGWEHSYGKRLRELPGGDVELFDGQGRRDLFAQRAEEEGAYEPPKGRFEELVKHSAGWLLTDPGNVRTRFDRFGRMVEVLDAVKRDEESGNGMRFSYDPAGRLVTIEDSLSRRYQLDYSDAGRLTQLTDFSGHEVHYEYDDEGRLTAVRQEVALHGAFPVPQEIGEEYEYEEAGGLTGAARLTRRDNLTSATDPKGQPWLDLTFGDADGDGRADEVTGQQWGSGSLSIAYDFGGRSATVTDRNGHPTSYLHNQAGQVVRVEDAKGLVVAREVDEEGLVTRETYPQGRVVDYVYDTASARRSRGNLLQTVVTPDARGPNGSSPALVTTLEHDPVTNQPTRITTPRGKITVIERDEAGLPLAIVEAVGTPEERVSTFVYNAFGQPIQAVNANGHATRYDYFAFGSGEGYLERTVVDDGGLSLATGFEVDAKGRVTAIVDPRGVRHDRTYNALGWLLSKTQAATASNDGAPALGLRTTYGYDENGNLVEKLLPFGDAGESTTYVRYHFGELDELLRLEREIGGGEPAAVETYSYDENLNRTVIARPDGQVTRTVFDERNLPTQVISGFGSPEAVTESLSFDLDDQLVTRVDGRGKTWTRSYDGYGRLKQALDPLGNRAAFEYENHGQPTRELAFDGTGTQLAEKVLDYDLLDRVTHQTEKLFDPAQPTSARNLVTQATYDDLGNVLTATDPLGRVTRTVYDTAERRTEVRDAAGNREVYELDPAGNVTARNAFDKKPDGSEVLVRDTMRYDALGRRTERKDALGNTWASSYDARGNTRFAIDPEGHVVESRFDGLDRLRKSVQPESVTVDYVYDKSSRLTSYKDALGHETRYSHDALDRLTSTVYPDTTTWSFTYDPAGNTTEIVDGRGTTITQAFDDANRLVSRQASPGGGTLPGATTESFEHDGLGRLTRAQSGSIVTRLAYDSLSRLLSEETAGREVAYALDDAGNRTSITYPSGKVVGQVFDAIDRPTTIGTRLSSVPGPPEDVAAAFAYQGRALVAAKTLKNGLASTRTFDPTRRLLEDLQQTAGGEPVFHESLAWSPRGLKVAESRGDLNGEGFLARYDGAGRLLARAETPGATATVPNNSVPSAAALAASESRESFTYDPTQNLTARQEVTEGIATATSMPPDASGRNRPASIAGEPVAYDANGNLTAKGDLRYAYDFRNRLVEVTTSGGTTIATYTYDAFNRRIRTESPGQPDEETTYAGWREIEQYEDGVLTSRRTFGLGLDEIVAIEADLDGDGEVEAAYSPVYDATSNLVAITGTNGKPIEKYEYSPYGERKIFVDLTPPRIDQVRKEGPEIWVEVSEDVLGAVLEAEEGDGLRLTNTATSLPVSFSVSQPVSEGALAGRRIVLALPLAPQEGTPLRLEVAAAAMTDSFLNTLTSPFTLDFPWPAGDVALFDDAPPEVVRVAVRDRRLEVTFSEEVTLASAAAITLGGSTPTWTLDESGYRLTSTTELPPGAHTLAISTALQDLAGTGLPSGFSQSFTLTPQAASLLAYQQPDPREVPTSTVGNALGFHGRPVDEATGLIYFRNRWYSPELGRFVSTDPMGYQDAPALYQAFLNDPVNGSDPLGLDGVIVNANGEKERETGPHLYQTLLREGMSREQATRWVVAAGFGDEISYDTTRQMIPAMVAAEKFVNTGTAVTAAAWSLPLALAAAPAVPAMIETAKGACLLNPAACTGAALAGTEVALGVEGPSPVDLPVPAMRIRSAASYMGVPLLGRPKQVSSAGIVEALRGTTEQANRIAGAIERRDIRLNVVTNRLFAEKWAMAGDGGRPPGAFAIKRQIFVRKSAFTLLGDVVHEGTHALDWANSYWPRLFLREKRAHFYERQFQIAIGMKPDHETIEDMLNHIRFHYGGE